MKKTLLTAAVCLLSFGLYAQESAKSDEGFQFTTVKENAITPVKNQNRSSTCWSFSGIGLLESELLRQGKGEYDLSEMFIVHHTMLDRAELYVRLHGDSSFSPGGSFYDVIATMKKDGLVPQEAMEGIKYGEERHIHTEIDAVASGYVNAIAKGRFKKLTPVWKEGLKAIYDTYLGECPEKFTYKGKEYTPRTFADELGLKAEDYISLTSYTHHPFYEQFVIEIQDNWRGGLSYNLPIDEFMEVMDYAVKQGFTIAWGSDVSEVGFTRNGIAVMPDLERTDLSGSDMARWTGMTPADKSKEAVSKPGPEVEATQEMRQAAFDNWETTDDHGMLIYGIAKDQTGKEYFMVKNSWGTDNKYEGTWYASKPFVRYKTMNIVLHKDALPKAIAKKLGLK
ncbi:peptidase C1B bleomycin hydrolase [Bacteroides coprosuis DSM 18011]|uniref:Aminopeptidase n=1 Tax=Bacteroides coprosuis DSM 18011 TaxID=679937 RepID=F3ZNS3_9BACE|nr:C1 family peptidase [Bacteroides coprosuis]EGJ70262.1 peptidase C1B bleomycin hydrolase [Bacteroides coprosuis DSM 18011]